MSILGTCPECLHHTDGMCNLRPRICFNYDHFERRPTVTLSRDVFETQYISRATFDAEVARLTEALSAANEDAELPDYNPNGTANPKGDAAYWRTRAEAAENVINAAHAVLVRQVAEPHTSRGDTNAMVEAITILETVTLKGGEG